MTVNRDKFVWHPNGVIEVRGKFLVMAPGESPGSFKVWPYRLSSYHILIRRII